MRDVYILAVNFKVYPSAFGRRALEVVKAAERVAREFEGTVSVIIAPPHTEIARISSSVERVIVYAQHVDPVEPGAHTGSVPVEAVKEAGARGSLVNHSERKLRLDEIERVVERLKVVGLEQLVCADTPRAAAAIAVFEPTYVAVEPPELIGTGIAVSRAKPEVVTKAVESVTRVSPNVPVLVGAGIVSREDARRSVELGARGVLVASAVMKAADPYAKMRELAEGLAPRR
ncbi:triosephosphate isomerase [Pyrolobus fumarii 1A]|uniref:Triosephosphate isomerase n=1 Tax=Pyrolobus fumarii (strain DSM 11204 / 1A) TaxID=694429 RepID=G0EE64_PYRF1|nr:triose-phosphate isomerase [Pyrolobus fumarii]AEM38758.1 triosephosphate isomerase [Pyrolobus fumarii 1A]